MSEIDYRYSIIPARAITDPSLKPRDLKILALLGRHTNKNGWCRRSQRTLAAEAKCVRSTVQASLDRLTSCGYVKVRLEGLKGKAPPQEGTHPFRSHSYRVLLDLDDQQIQKATEGRARKIGHLSSDENRRPVPTLDENSREKCGGIYAAPRAEAHNDSISPDFFEDSEFSTGAEIAENEQSSARNIEPSPSELSPCEPLAREAESIAELGPQISAFLAAWPTASTDSHSKISAHWGKLSIDDRKAAMAGVEPFLAELKKNGRERIISGWKYLAEKRWQLVIAPVGNVHAFETWTRDWWAVLLAKLDKGERANGWFNYADLGGMPAKRFCAVKVPDMPSLDQLALLSQYPSDGEALTEWRPWFEARGLRLPRWSNQFWIFLPGPTPPEGKQSIWSRRA